MEVATDHLPHRLELVVDFVNTRDLDEATDELSSAAALRAWLVARGLITESAVIRRRDVADAIDLRESLRVILLSHRDAATAPAEAVAALDRVAARGELSTCFGADDAFVTVAPRRDGLPGALARLLGPVTLASLDGTWDRVKACAADDCQWAFYDRSRNRSGRWCDMAACGNRTKVRTYRQRARGA